MDRRRPIVTALLGLAALGALAACAPSIDVQSNLDPDYHPRLQRVFVVLNTRQLDDATQVATALQGEFAGGEVDTSNFTRLFVRSLMENSPAAGVQVQGHVITGVELSPDEFLDRARDFKADAVLYVNEAHVVIEKNSDVLGLMATRTVKSIELDAFIRNHGTGEVVWRARLKADAGRSDWRGMAKFLAKSLLDQLAKDGLISTEAPPPPSPATTGV